jgi:hypothetical protein
MRELSRLGRLIVARRQGDSAAARMLGGYRSDKDIQSDDIKDLAKNLGDFVVKTKGP